MCYSCLYFSSCHIRKIYQVLEVKMSNWDNRPEGKEHSPENDCEKCYQKKYCSKPCRARKNYIDQMIGFSQIKDLSEGIRTSGYLTTEEDELKYKDVESFITTATSRK